MDRKFRQQTRPESGDLRKRQGSQDAPGELGGNQLLRRVVHDRAAKRPDQSLGACA